MHRMRAVAWLVAGGLALLPLNAPLAAESAPEMTEEQVRTLLHDSLGVEVLRIEVVEQVGPAYAVTVMMPPGNRNNAYMVATLLVDGATGALLGRRSQAPRTAASDLPTATGRQIPESGGQDIRRRTWR